MVIERAREEVAQPKSPKKTSKRFPQTPQKLLENVACKSKDESSALPGLLPWVDVPAGEPEHEGDVMSQDLAQSRRS